jgi:NADH-quinone oxidoreductase subunit M
MNGLLSALTFLPLLGGIVVLFLKSGNCLPRRAALVASLLAFALAFVVCGSFDPASGAMQLVERCKWIEVLAVEYHLGVDGLGVLMILLTAIVTPLSLLVAKPITDKNYFALVLFLQSGLFGTFTAQNFFHWFLFWELALIPAFFLVRLWGGMDRGAAATQFFVYTMVGSVAMLLAFLALYLGTGSFDFEYLATQGRNGDLVRALAGKLAWAGLSGEQLGLLVFLGVLLGLAVKVPMFPLHTWLPATYAEAPSSVTMLLTGLMSKMGMYGFLRLLLPIFPEQTRALLTPLLWLAVATIVLSAAAAFAQRDLKRMFAYSSINHLGYCLLAIFAVVKLTDNSPAMQTEKAAAFNGVLLQMFNHGLTAAAIFAFIAMIEERSGGLRGLNQFGGLRKVAPVFTGLMGIAIFSSLGLPGLNGFVGEFLIFKGVFALAPWAAALSVIGLLVTAIFLLTIIQRVFSGPLNEKWTAFADLTLRERWVIAPVIALMFVLGIYPQLLIGLFNATVVQWVSNLKAF